MCGIVGYTGVENAPAVLLDGLKRLEYRGYDSAGLAVLSADGIECVKKSGRIANVEKYSSALKDGGVGIGHTRWATHGEPSDVNSHPHLSCDGKIAVVHNGIIENYMSLKEMLIREGVSFVSETDTEVIPKLLSYYYNGDMRKTLSKVISMLNGSYALGIICTDCPDTVFAVKKDSPLVIGVNEKENFIASDLTAYLSKTNKFIFPEDNQICVIKKDSVKVYSGENEITPEISEITWSVEVAEKTGYEHFMLKEMYEQGRAVKDTLSQFISKGTINCRQFEGIGKYSSLKIVACGSAYHVALTGKYIIEKLCRVPVEVVIASEFRYRNPILGKDELVIVISQSGETADTLAALREAKARGTDTMAIVNVYGSSIAREADKVIYTYAGPEIAVATTKAYSAQLAVVYALSLSLAAAKGKLSFEELEKYAAELARLPELIEKLCKKAEELKEFAGKHMDIKSVFYIGRDYDYASGMEGSLKLKEISYISSEAYAAGELKHGTISLIDENTVVVALATSEAVKEKTFSNIKEVKARKATVFTITTEKDTDAGNYADYVFTLPEASEIFYPSLSLIPMQFYAYYTALLAGKDIDKPRNLAKSVTVE